MVTSADGNLFENLPAAGAEEEFTALLASPGLHVSRIVSHGHASPAGFWYDQLHGEWVLLLAGALQSPPAEKLPYSILYASNAGTPYSAAWEKFLGEHAARVTSIAGSDLKRSDLAGFDLLVIDGKLLVPMVFVTGQETGDDGVVVTIDPPEGLLDL